MRSSEGERSADPPHGILSAVILKRWLSDKALNKMQASQLTAVIGGHHGDWITSTEMGQARTSKEKWRKLQNEILHTMEDLLGLPDIALPATVSGFNVFAASVRALYPSVPGQALPARFFVQRELH